jgi:hypothetical protein
MRVPGPYCGPVGAPMPVGGLVMSAPGDSGKPEAGAPASEKMALPKGLDWETVSQAVRVIEDWESESDGVATDLVIRLFPVLCGR